MLNHFKEKCAHLIHLRLMFTSFYDMNITTFLLFIIHYFRLIIRTENMQFMIIIRINR